MKLNLFFAVALALAPGPTFAAEHMVDMQAVATYARVNKVSTAEAKARLGLQEIVSDFQEEVSSLAPEIYSGLYIEHTPKFRVVLRTTTTDAKEIVSLLLVGKYKALKNVLEIRPTKHTLSELLAVLPKLSEYARQINQTVDLDVDVVNNIATINTTDKSSLASKFADAGIALPETAEIREVKSLAKELASIGGGVSISECTSGFSVVRSDGVRGITTAAHCTNTAQYYNGTYLPYVAGVYGGDWDVQWHTTGSYVPTNVVWNGASYIRITGMRGRIAQSVGDYVCKHGQTDGYRCGYIRSTTFQPSNIPNATPTWVTVAVYAADGDSGAPFFNGSTAYGILSAIYSTGTEWRTIYMGADRIKSGLGVDVLLTP